MKNTKKASVKNRTSKMKLEGEFSSLDYKVIASGSIISKTYEALEKILDKYPKNWEKEIKWGSKS